MPSNVQAAAWSELLHLVCHKVIARQLACCQMLLVSPTAEQLEASVPQMVFHSDIHLTTLAWHADTARKSPLAAMVGSFRCKQAGCLPPLCPPLKCTVHRGICCP